MNIVLLSHPAFLGLQSQDHFARMLLEAYRARGHAVELRRPTARLRARLRQGGLAKWAGYVDQYLLFPTELLRWMASDPPDTLYVFCDQALGPWVPLLAHRPHVVHCHDLLALRSALGLVPENPTSATGRLYQRLIRAGFRRARHFISISRQTQADLHRHGGVVPETSVVVYNGLNHAYRPMPVPEALATLREAGQPLPDGPFLLHVGGGQWYKNAAGVVALYAALARRQAQRGLGVPGLWMVGPEPDATLRRHIAALPAGASVRRLAGLPAPVLQAVYSGAECLLFPSLAEGFGWPIAEALACGCPVLTTGEAPMTEVGGEFACYLPRLRQDEAIEAWAEAGAEVLARLLERPVAEKAAAAEAGHRWAAQFEAGRALDGYLEVYRRVLARALGCRVSDDSTPVQP